MNTIAVKNLLKICIVSFALLIVFLLVRNYSLAVDCPPGETPNDSGQCIKVYCPPGETPNTNGQCEQIPSSCPPGEIPNDSGKCVPEATSTPRPSVTGTTDGSGEIPVTATNTPTPTFSQSTGGGNPAGPNACSPSQYEDPLVHTCSSLKPNGTACNAYYECSSGYCDSGNTCKTPAGSSCTNSDQCGALYYCDGGSCVRNPTTGGGTSGGTGGTGGVQGGGEVAGGTPPVVPTVCTPGQITCKCPLADQQWICSPLTEIIPSYKQAKENALNTYPQLRTLCYHQAPATCTLPSNVPPSPTVSGCQKNRGDADCANGINALDFKYWFDWMRGAMTTIPGIPTINADFNGDRKINLFDFEIWRRNTGSYK